MVGTARCAVPARVVAGGMKIRATMALEGIAPLHAARTSQRDVPAMLHRYGGLSIVLIVRSSSDCRSASVRSGAQEKTEKTGALQNLAGAPTVHGKGTPPNF